MRLVYCLFVALACRSAAGFSFKLECLRAEKYEWPVIKNVFTCIVTNMQITQQSSFVNSQDQTASFKGLWIFQQTLHYLPRFSASLAQRLEALLVYDCRFKSIDRHDLEQFPNLRELWLNENDLQTLESDLFEFTTQLEFVSFRGNNLKIVESRILEPLTHVKGVWFGDGGCINQKASTPEEIQSLKSQLQSKCKTSEMKDIMEENENLKETNKKLENKIEKLTRFLPVGGGTREEASTDSIVCVQFSVEKNVCNVKDFTSMNSETEIGTVKSENGYEVRPSSLIVRNQIVLFLPKNLHKSFSDLTKLEVSGSKLTKIDQVTLKQVSKLEHLNLSGNNIVSIANDTFSAQKDLKTLDLSHNMIETIEVNAFSGLDELRIFALNDNKLSEIAVATFWPLKSLTKLDLANNICVDYTITLTTEYSESLFEQVERKIKQDCALPIEFDCDPNNDESHICVASNLRVKSLKPKSLKVRSFSSSVDRPSITAFIVEKQTFNFFPDQISRTFPKLQRLIVSLSLLKSLDKNDFCGLHSLTWVEICNNNLQSIHAETFKCVPQLIHLDLTSNNIQTLPPGIFGQLIQLKELRLAINKIKILKADILPMTNNIRFFKIEHNKLVIIERIFLRSFQESEVVDLSGNICTQEKYQRFDDNSRFKWLKQADSIAEDCKFA